jgi:hypothetical protein
MGLMEPGCKSEDFGRLVQPAATNRLRCRVNVVSERYLDETHIVSKRCSSRSMFGLCMVTVVVVWFLRKFWNVSFFIFVELFVW